MKLRILRTLHHVAVVFGWTFLEVVTRHRIWAEVER